jgi:predicted metal-dependent hydrolase
MIGALLPDIWPYIIGLVSLLGVALGLYRKGRKDVRTESALEAAERMAKAHENRSKIEDEIQQDVDLVARAAAAGIVRDGSE